MKKVDAMISYRDVLRTGCLLATAALAAAQPTVPRPAPVAPEPPVPPEPFELAYPLPAPMPMPQNWGDMDAVREQLESLKDRWKDQMADLSSQMKLDLNLKIPTALFAQDMGMAGRKAGLRRVESDDRLYEAGLRALDGRRWDEALESFNQVASRGGPRADAGWYWKAYTLNRLGRREEALAAIAELRKSYASSRWLDDAKALEVEVKQAAGRPVSPESESDEELKLLAINGLMQSDSDRAIPLLENILKGSNSPKLKDRALFVLAQSSAPRAQQVLEQIARGGGNPDLQVRAILYLTQRRRGSNMNQNLLPEIYNSTADPIVKRAILNAYMSNHDFEHLAQIAKNEKLPELRESAFQQLGNNTGQPELWQIYQGETSPEVRQQLLKCMYNNGNSDRLAEVARSEKDPAVRRTAIEVLASQRGSNTGDQLVAIYNSEQDPHLKQTIIDHLSSQRSAKYLVDLARSEKDPKMKLRIVDRLSNMKSKEASDYLMELLSK